MFSLAEDYMGAGLFDRAEQLFAQLSDSPTLAESSLERLVHIYEREKEWQKAIDVHRKLEILRGTKSSQVAHYYCELAESARAAGDRALAREHLRNSVRSESGALRGTLIRAALAQEEKDYSEAIALYEQVIATDRHFVIEVLPEVLRCYRDAGRLPEFELYVGKLVMQDASLRRELAFATVIGGLTESPALAESVERFVLDNAVLQQLVDIEELKSLPTEERRRTIERIAGGLRQIAMSSARYRCTNCGYSTQRFIWHCPSCKLWETVRPIQSLPLETILA